MHPVANHLIQLQELVLIRDEQKIAGAPERLEALNESIKTMTAKLPADARARFDKLVNKDHVAICPVVDGSCAVCRMKLPISLVQSVRMAKEIQQCPSCARLLYDAGTAPRRTGGIRSRTEPLKAGISRFSSSSLMVANLEAEGAEGAIRVLAHQMEQEGYVQGADQLVELAMSREVILSTAVDNGLAVPHVRGVEGGGLTLALGVSRKGIAFDGADTKPTHLVFFIVIPIAASAFYLKLLAGLAETFVKVENRKAILACKDEETLWKTLVKVTRTTIK
jgi:mannitol/fructose-specific phosphotransferase system IIA component (Ntr-type)